MSYQRTPKEEENIAEERAADYYRRTVHMLRELQEVYGVKCPSYVLYKAILLADLVARYADENGDILIGKPGEIVNTTIHLRK